MANGRLLWPRRAAKGWKSSKLGALVAPFNAPTEDSWRLSRSFPRSRRHLLIGSLAVVTLTAIAVRAPLLGGGYAAPDTKEYLKIAEGIFHGGFSGNLRPPAYSFLLAIFDTLGVDPVDAVVLLQNVVGMLLPAVVLLAGWRFFNPLVGILAGFLTAASPLMQITEQLALADYLFGVTLFVATALLAESALRVRAGRWPLGLLIATGAIFGLATLFRANGLLSLVAVPLVLFVAAPNLKRGMKSAAVTVVAVVLVIAPWSLHNLIRFGDPSPASEGGISLYARAVTWDAVPPPDDTPEGALAREIYNTADPGEPGRPASGQPTTALFNALVHSGRTPSEASSVMGGLAREAILAHPGIFLENTWSILRRYRDLYDPTTFWADPNSDHIAETRHYFQFLNLPDDTELTEVSLARRELPGDSPLTRAPWQLAQALTAILYVGTLGGLLILLLLVVGPARRRLAAFAFVLVLLIAFAGGSLTAVFSQRYDIMFAPFVWLLLAATAVLLLEMARASVPSRSAPRFPAAQVNAGLAALRSQPSRLKRSSARQARAARAAAARIGAAWTPFLLSRAALPAVAFLAPFSATKLAGSLTLGRVAAVALAAALALDFARARPRDLRFGAPAILAGAAYLGLFFWILISAGAWGCNCDGKLGGFAEFAFVGLLALAVISFAPGLRTRIVLAVLGGLGLAALLALLGVGAINSGTVDLTQTGGRLSGTYGNANELGFALAIALPIAFAFALAERGRRRLIFAAVLAVLGLALVLTFSRGGAIAAALGIVAVGLWSLRGSRRGVLMILGGAAVAALVAAATYSVFERERQDASFDSVSPALRPLDQRDLSGWDKRALGPIPAGPSRMHNRPDGIVVHGGRGEGASFRWGEAAADGSYVLRIRARSAGPERIPISFALGDAIRGGGPEGQATLGARPRLLELAWHPRRPAPHATLYVWQRAAGAASFVLGEVSVRTRAPGQPERIITVPDKLRGSPYAHLTAAAENQEDRYVRSRLDAADLALDAFASDPLRGIGWATFPTYADEHLDYGQLAAHDEYLSIAAELGILGLLLLGMLGGAIFGGVRRAGDGAAETAAIGALTAAAAGLIFVEALPIPQLSIPVAMAVAVICARRAAEPRS